jgi:uncharacterized protein
MTFPGLITPFAIKRHKSHFLLVNGLGCWTLARPDAYHQLLRGILSSDSVLALIEQGVLYDYEKPDCVDEHFLNSMKPYLGGPHLHIIPVTTDCNLNCVYCRTSKTRASASVNPPLPRLTRMIDFILSGPQPKVFLEFGIGEPLLRPEILLELMRYAKRLAQRKKKEIVFKVTTNGTRLKESIIDVFAKNKVQIGFSLDGPKLLHDRQRPSLDGSSSYDAVSSWIRDLLKGNYPKISSSVTVTRWTIAHLGEIVDEYVRLGLESISLRFVGCQGRAEDRHRTLLVNNAMIRKYLPQTLRKIVDLNKQGVRLRETYLSLFCEKILKAIQPAHTELMSPCGFAIGQLAYSSDGTIYGCEECLAAMKFPLGHVETDSLNSVLAHPIVGTVLRHSFLDDLACTPCPYRPFCGQCPVIAYQQSNSFLPMSVRSNRCATTRIYCDFIFDSIMNRDPAFRAYCHNFDYRWRSFDSIITKGGH